MMRVDVRRVIHLRIITVPPPFWPACRDFVEAYARYGGGKSQTSTAALSPNQTEVRNSRALPNSFNLSRGHPTA